jgi:GTP 3',8-cyclase
MRDLRISVTDRCNFRCRYCMPREAFDRDHAFLARQALLSFEEITRLAGLFVAQGVTKLRLTGGEPLVRRDLPKLVAMLAKLGTAARPVDLTLTTNGVLLAEHAAALKQAGLQRVTVSLDSLDQRVFEKISDTDHRVEQVLAGIDAAARVGLAPIKVNAVVQRGVNDHTLVDLARHFRGSGHVLRFIEYMDVGNSNGWRMDNVVGARQIVEQVDAMFPLAPADRAYRGEVASRYRYRDGSGEIGVIASVTQPFCGDCTRVRLSPDGKVFTCLFATAGVDLRAPLRGGEDDGALAQRIAALWSQRSDRYSEQRTAHNFVPLKVEMSYIGG